MKTFPWVDEKMVVPEETAKRLLAELFKHTFSERVPKYPSLSKWAVLRIYDGSTSPKLMYHEHVNQVMLIDRITKKNRLKRREPMYHELTLPHSWREVEFEAWEFSSLNNTEMEHNYPKQVIAKRLGDMVHLYPLKPTNHVHWTAGEERIERKRLGDVKPVNF